MDMSDLATLTCGTCGAALEPGDRFCERCGTRAAPPDAPAEAEISCSACGAPAQSVGGDHYCSSCGVRLRAPGDRVELDVASAAAVTDRGRARRRNEDAMHLERVGESGVVAVVCDGISSSLSADQAARRAADAAGDVLADALRSGSLDLAGATRRAAAAAQQEVHTVPWTSRSDLDYPSCTFVSAVCDDGRLVIGSVGDSRAYWIGADGALQLTTDDSWVQEQVALGLMSEPEANADPRAHSITRWLGRDAPDAVPAVVELAPEQPGRLVLCSDGLWNYAPAAADISLLLDALPSGSAAIAVARSLTETALAAGGHDNITVAVVDVIPPGRSEQ